MGILDKLFGRKKAEVPKKDWKEFDAKLPPLPSGWRRGVLDVFCSYKCYEFAGNSMLVSQGRSNPCLFCKMPVTYGNLGVTLLFDGKSPNVCCEGCFARAKDRLLHLQTCGVCGTEVKPSSKATLTEVKPSNKTTLVEADKSCEQKNCLILDGTQLLAYLEDGGGTGWMVKAEIGYTNSKDNLPPPGNYRLVVLRCVQPSGRENWRLVDISTFAVSDLSPLAEGRYAILDTGLDEGHLLADQVQVVRQWIEKEIPPYMLNFPEARAALAHLS